MERDSHRADVALAAPDREPDCTLDRVQLADRVLEWVDLSALALTTQRIDGGVASTYPASLANAVEDLARRENSCCGSWLTATVHRGDDSIRLEVTTEHEQGHDIILTFMNLCD